MAKNNPVLDSESPARASPARLHLPFSLQVERARQAHEIKKLTMKHDHEVRMTALEIYHKVLDETSYIARTTIRGDAKAPPFTSAEATFKFGGTPAPAATVLTTATNAKASGFSSTVGNGKKRRLNNDDERP
jgi:hypothetical protein